MGAKASVPAPDLVRPPLVPAMALLRLKVPEGLVTNTINSRLLVVESCPPEMLAETAVSRMPPLSIVSVCGDVIVTLPPVPRVNEFTVIGANSEAALVSETFARVASVVEISEALSARKLLAPVVVPAAAESAVAKESPVPVVLVSTSAQGTMPFLVVPVPPVWPTKVNPAVAAGPTTTAVLAAAALPRLVPRMRSVPPAALATAVLVPRVSVSDWALLGVNVMVLLPAL